MKTRISIIITAIFAAVIMAAGCQTTTSGPTHSAIGCDKCKTVWVPSAGPGKFTSYSTTSHMVCPDCTSAVGNYFKTGALKHACASCGGALKHCATH